MNKHEINQSQLNGSVIHNLVVGLGSATATLNFMAFERSLTLLSGSSTMSFSVLGDITKSAQIGTATAGITFGQSAALTVFREITIPSASTSIVFTQSAGLYSQERLPNASSSMTLAVAGDLYVVGDLAATAALAFNVSSPAGPQITKLLGAASSSLSVSASGSLTQYIIRTIPAATSVLEFDVKGSLTKHVKQYMSLALSPMAFDVTANLTRYGRVTMSGSAAMAFTEAATLRATLRMAANSGMAFTTTATITNKRVDIPATSISLSFAATASLSVGTRQAIPLASTTLTVSTAGTLTKKATIGLSVSGISLFPTANLSTIQKFNGSAGIEFSESASLFNNPNAIDPPAFVLIRPFVNRVLVRQS